MKGNGKFISISLLTFLGLIGALALQSIWLYNTYTLIRNNIQKESYAIIEKALQEEGRIRFGQTPKGTAIMGGPTNDTIPSMTYFYERLSDKGYPMSLERLDSITSVLLKENGIEDNYSIHLMNLHTGKILDKCGTQREPNWLTIKAKDFPIRADYTQVVRLIISHPYKTFLARMGLLIIATVFILVFVISCIIYLIKIIRRQNKIFQLREDFSYAMIHDMKTPLSSIIMSNHALSSGKLDAKPEIRKNFHGIIAKESEHLLALTNKVLTISKLEHEKMKMVKAPVPIQPLIEEMIEKFKTIATKPIRFETEFKTDTVMADKEYLQEAISNLIDNALKYSRQDITIRIASWEEGDYRFISVRDNGIGIPAKDLPNIFNKFERASSVRSGKGGRIAGFGLGLNYVYQVMQAHGGKVSVESREGEYSEFTLYLPQS